MDMDRQDKEFEDFLGQFELRQHRPFPTETAVDAGRKTHRWMLAVAAVAVAALLSIPLVRNFVHSAAPVASIEVAGDSAYKEGEKIHGAIPVQAGGFESLVLSLEDGTRVELRAGSEALLEPADDGVRIRLNRGAALVHAAKQKGGHLYVETQDAEVSVVGTVFLVEKKSLGTVVGVCEGEVEVREGGLVRKLVQGEQASTNPGEEKRSLAEAIAWSRNAPELVALLQPPAVAQQSGGTVPEKQPEQPKKGEEPKPEAPPQPEAPPPAPKPVKKVPPPQEQGQQGQPLPSTPAPAPAPQNPPVQADAGADGPGKEILNRACGACHVVGIVETTRYASREAYASLVSRQMAYGAQVSEAEASVLVDYLFRTYGVRTSKP